MEERKTEEANLNNLEKNPSPPPPKTSSPSNVSTPVHEDCGPSGSKEELKQDQPSSPESISMEQHFSWLIQLLDEPDTHRPSSNDLYLHRPQHHSNPQQQFPQRSRVQNLQYINELENCVQALQAQGLEVLAQLQYVDRQNYILSFENEVLKHRLNSMLHQQFMRCIQNDMLKREVRRLHQLFYRLRPPQPFMIPRSN
ncbi:Transcription factor RF2b [Dendrobium catenatum]|uniref:Transcription factor RF2b n=1 Tax=Dendrobium catenatum TaxID=906689 RepID=A0A2I0X516_9ASPA|nr:Transcription factor RF2b [Dendrobium catenatum]